MCVHYTNLNKPAYKRAKELKHKRNMWTVVAPKTSG